MLKIAVTGGIACGKSLVGAFMRNAGITVLDADDVAHQLIEKDLTVYDEIVQEFGVGVLGSSDEIDRKILGCHVFGDHAELQKLNRIIHPAVRSFVDTWLKEQAVLACSNIVVVIIPLLFEAGFHEGWDKIICVSAAQEIQRKRLKGAGIVNVEERIMAQWSSARKALFADYVIINNGSENILKQQLDIILKNIME